uniref:Putative molecular chaperone prefoldin subunit 5 n=2 Tax=Triatominae TaxID=70999 RepID=A0A0V0G8A3_TRIDM
MSSKEKPEMQQIELNKLPLQNLTQIKKQLDQELGVFQDSLQALKIAQTKYKDTVECLDKIKPDAKGSDIMVPLTGSMFVPGKIDNVDKVLVDVGTGYYLNMNLDSARDYFKRKVTFVTEQMEKIQAIGLEKSKIREAIMDIMDSKIQAQMANQRSARATAGASN